MAPALGFSSGSWCAPEFPSPIGVLRGRPFWLAEASVHYCPESPHGPRVLLQAGTWHSLTTQDAILSPG